MIVFKRRTFYSQKSSSYNSLFVYGYWIYYIHYTLIKEHRICETCVIVGVTQPACEHADDIVRLSSNKATS